MSIVFAVRGDSFNARYAGGSKTPTQINSGSLALVASGGALSGSYIDMGNSANIHALSYSGYKNTANGRAFSILLRFAPTYSAAPAGRRVLYELSFGAGGSGPGLQIYHETTGAVTVQCKNETATFAFNFVSFGTWNTNVANTYYDMVFEWDGTTSANAAKVYIDAVLLGQATAAAALTSSWDNTYFKSIVLGMGTNGTGTAIRIDEFVIWDTVITPSSVTLVSGSGSLNGASRTSLVDVISFEGGVYSDPGIANVKTGTSYTYAGTSQTGTYDGSDRWTDPGQTNVRSATAYKANSTSNNKTGSLDLPAIGNVKTGVTFDGASQTGTYDGSDRWTDPGQTNVRSATAYKANSTSNNKTGTLDLPSTANVKTGVTFDGLSQTGTYDGSDRWTDPGVTNVRLSTAYKANSTSNNRTGTLDLPAESDVNFGVTFDNGTKTGTLVSTPVYLTLAQFLALKDS